MRRRRTSRSQHEAMRLIQKLSITPNRDKELTQQNEPSAQSIIKRKQYSPSEVLQLQQQIGNQATMQLLRQASGSSAQAVKSNMPSTTNPLHRQPLKINKTMSRVAIARKKKAMHLDFVRMKRKKSYYAEVVMNELGMATKHDDLYGHWWTEVGDMDQGDWDPEHSYGWWPDKGDNDIGFTETFKGVPGILNAGEPEDPHHDDEANTEFHPTMMVDEDADYDTVRAQVTTDIENFANSFQGSWNWRLGWGKNCQTFQARMKKQLGLHNQKSKRWLRNPGQTWRQILMAEYEQMLAERREAERLRREAWEAQQEAERLQREAEEAEQEAERLRLEQEAARQREEEAQRLAEERKIQEAEREAKLARRRERQARKDQREADRKARREAPFIPIPEDIETAERTWSLGTGDVYTPRIFQKGTRIKISDSGPIEHRDGNMYYSMNILDYSLPGVSWYLSPENGAKMLGWAAAAKQEAEAKDAKEEQEDDNKQDETVDNTQDEKESDNKQDDNVENV